MKLFRSARWALLALLLSIVPVSSFAGIFISVGFAPPPLPVYEQPACPDANMIWMPGYWAYGEQDYYWVPGAWTEPPYEGAMWTPAYWGWEDGQYVFHDGYWADHVGYYGGVNYGYGYMGIGFVGGEWRGGRFFYNTAVTHVNIWKVHNIFSDRGLVDRYTFARGSHIAFSGGPGGIHYEPSREERMYEHDQRTERTEFQYQHEYAAKFDRDSYFHSNGGHPHNMAVERLIKPDTRFEQQIKHEQDMRHDQPRPDGRPMQNVPERHDDQRYQQNNYPQQQAHPDHEMKDDRGYQPGRDAQQPRPNQPQQQRTNQQPNAQPQPQQRPAPQQNAAPAQHAAPQNTTPPQHAAPASNPAPTHAAPAQNAAPQKSGTAKPDPKDKDKKDK